MTHRCRFTPAVLALLVLLLPAGASAEATDAVGLWRGAKTSAFTEEEADRFQRDLGQAGSARKVAVRDVQIVRKGKLVGACGTVDAGGRTRPFYALYRSDLKPVRWDIDFPKSEAAKHRYAVLSVCARMGIVLPAWKDIVAPTAVGSPDGNRGNVKLKPEQRAILERDVGEKAGLGAPAALSGLVTGLVKKGRSKLTVVCGFARRKEGGFAPFYGVWIKTSSKGPARFGVSGYGDTPARSHATHQLCDRDGISLARTK